VLAFGHLSVLVSIVVGLSISQMLFGLGQLMRRRGTYPLDAAYLLTNVIILLVLVDCWWSVFSWHDEADWSYRMTWCVLLNPLLMTMAAQLIPPDWDERPLDITAAYRRNRRLIFGLLALYPLLDMVDTALKGTAHFRSLGPGYPLSSMAMAVLCALAAFASNRSLQIACCIGILLVVLSWIFEIYSVVPL
jgi:hypothetical protein